MRFLSFKHLQKITVNGLSHFPGSQAPKLMDQWLLVVTLCQMSTLWVRKLFCLSADNFAKNHLGNSGGVARLVRHVARCGILVWKWTLGYQHRWHHQDGRRFPQYLHLHLRHDTTRQPRIRDAWTRCGLVHAGLKSTEVLDAQHARLLVLGNLTLVNVTLFKMLGKSRRTATTEEVKRAIEGEQDTRPLDPSSSATDPDPKRLKLTTMTGVENLANHMDEDTSLQTPATSHPLELDAEENVSKKA